VPGRKERVELVESGAGAERPGADAGPERSVRSREPWWGRLARAWPVALLLLVLATAYLVAGGRERARLEERYGPLRGQEAFAEDLGEGRPAWELYVPAQWLVPSSAGDVLLLQIGSFTGRVSHLAVDPGTGEELWRVTDTEDSRRECAGEVTLLDGAISCFHTSSAGTTVERRELASGELLSEWEWAAGTSRSALWGDGVVHVATEGASSVVRLEGPEGDRRWSVPLRTGPLAAGELVTIEVRREHVVVAVRDLVVAIDLGGRLLVEESSERWGDEDDGARTGIPHLRLEPLRSGGWILGSWYLRPERSFVLDEAGELVFAAEGAVEQLVLDDGSMGPVLLRRDSRVLELVDPATGEARLTVPRIPESEGYLVDGILVSVGSGRMSAVDLESGEELWLHTTVGLPVASDGRVLVVQEGFTRPARVRGIDLATGETLWEIETGGVAARAFTAGGALFVHDGATLSRVGRPTR
jgi:outer membrane protein assembly factor BamB